MIEGRDDGPQKSRQEETLFDTDGTLVPLHHLDTKQTTAPPLAHTKQANLRFQQQKSLEGRMQQQQQQQVDVT